jgi:hypothetical protein
MNLVLTFFDCDYYNRSRRCCRGDCRVARRHILLLRLPRQQQQQQQMMMMMMMIFQKKWGSFV